MPDDLVQYTLMVSRRDLERFREIGKELLMPVSLLIRVVMRHTDLDYFAPLSSRITDTVSDDASDPD